MVTLTLCLFLVLCQLNAAQKPSARQRPCPAPRIVSPWLVTGSCTAPIVALHIYLPWTAQDPLKSPSPFPPRFANICCHFSFISHPTFRSFGVPIPMLSMTTVAFEASASTPRRRRTLPPRATRPSRYGTPRIHRRPSVPSTSIRSSATPRATPPTTTRSFPSRPFRPSYPSSISQIMSLPRATPRATCASSTVAPDVSRGPSRGRTRAPSAPSPSIRLRIT